MSNIIDGKAIAANILKNIKASTQERLVSAKSAPGLAVILVGNDPASEIYVSKKKKTCEELGFHSVSHHLEATISEADLLSLIESLNQDNTIHGILVQLPLPQHIDVNTVIETISPQKDVDGFHPFNIGKLTQRMPQLRPCTPFGIIKMLESLDEPFKGKHAVVVGASNIVGRPLTLELLLAGVTVTTCHRFTQNLEHHVTQADILVAAVGKPHLIPGSWVKPGATVIDVGVNRLEDGSLVGDIEFDIAKTKARWITPVPGGVGPMTIAMLMHNTLEAAQLAD